MIKEEQREGERWEKRDGGRREIANIEKEPGQDPALHGFTPYNLLPLSRTLSKYESIKKLIYRLDHSR